MHGKCIGSLFGVTGTLGKLLRFILFFLLGLLLLSCLASAATTAYTPVRSETLVWYYDGEWRSLKYNDLFLADQPCIFTMSIDDADLVIALPIGPRKAFMATKSEHVATIMRRQRPKDLLMRINESSLNQARVRVYARDSSPRRFICNRLAERGG